MNEQPQPQHTHMMHLSLKLDTIEELRGKPKPMHKKTKTRESKDDKYGNVTSIALSQQNLAGNHEVLKNQNVYHAAYVIWQHKNFLMIRKQ